jgi:hypothetical protein
MVKMAKSKGERAPVKKNTKAKKTKVTEINGIKLYGFEE